MVVIAHGSETDRLVFDRSATGHGPIAAQSLELKPADRCSIEAQHKEYPSGWQDLKIITGRRFKHPIALHSGWCFDGTPFYRPTNVVFLVPVVVVTLPL